MVIRMGRRDKFQRYRSLTSSRDYINVDYPVAVHTEFITIFHNSDCLDCFNLLNELDGMSKS